MDGQKVERNGKLEREGICVYERARARVCVGGVRATTGRAAIGVLQRSRTGQHAFARQSMV